MPQQPEIVPVSFDMEKYQDKRRKRDRSSKVETSQKDVTCCFQLGRAVINAALSSQKTLALRYFLSIYLFVFFSMAQENVRSKIQRQSTSLLFVEWVPQVNGSSCGSTI